LKPAALNIPPVKPLQQSHSSSSQTLNIRVAETLLLQIGGVLFFKRRSKNNSGFEIIAFLTNSAKLKI
jgi:hypothetical protein